MNRNEMKTKVDELKVQAKGKIEAAPVPAFFVGVVLGVVFADYKQSILPLVLICAFIYFGFWLLAEQEAGQSSSKEANSDSKKDSKKKVSKK